MTIEFHTPHGAISEDIISYIKDNLMSCYHRDPEISRAEVYFRKNHNDDGNTAVCEVDLTVYGSSLMVYRTSDNFRKAAEEVVKEVNVRVDEWISQQKDPPDSITTTVRV